MNKAIHDAQKAFWQSIAKSHPEVMTGDIDPMVSAQFDNHCEAVVKHWKHINQTAQQWGEDYADGFMRESDDEFKLGKCDLGWLRIHLVEAYKAGVNREIL